MSLKLTLPVAAKDNPFATHRVEAVSFRFAEGHWKDHLERLQSMNWRAAIVGNQGTGKTTLMLFRFPATDEEGPDEGRLVIDLAHDPGVAVLMVSGWDEGDEDTDTDPAERELCFVLETQALVALAGTLARAADTAMKKDVEAGPEPSGEGFIFLSQCSKCGSEARTPTSLGGMCCGQPRGCYNVLEGGVSTMESRRDGEAAALRDEVPANWPADNTQPMGHAADATCLQCGGVHDESYAFCTPRKDTDAVEVTLRAGPPLGLEVEAVYQRRRAETAEYVLQAIGLHLLKGNVEDVRRCLTLPGSVDLMAEAREEVRERRAAE